MRCLNANVWNPEFVECMLKTGGSSEAVLEREDSSNPMLCITCSTVSLVPPVFNMQSTNSGLHTFALRRRVFSNPTNKHRWMGITTQYSSISVHNESIYSHLNPLPPLLFLLLFHLILLLLFFLLLLLLYLLLLFLLLFLLLNPLLENLSVFLTYGHW